MSADLTADPAPTEPVPTDPSPADPSSTGSDAGPRRTPPKVRRPAPSPRVASPVVARLAAELVAAPSEREAADVGLEDHLTVLDDDVGVAALGQGRQRGQVFAPSRCHVVPQPLQIDLGELGGLLLAIHKRGTA